MYEAHPKKDNIPFNIKHLSIRCLILLILFIISIEFSFNDGHSQSQNLNYYKTSIQISYPGWVITQLETLSWGKSNPVFNIQQILAENDDSICYGISPKNKSSICGIFFTTFNSPSQNNFQVNDSSVNIIFYKDEGESVSNIKSLAVYVFTNDGGNMSTNFYPLGEYNNKQKINLTIPIPLPKKSLYIKDIGLYWICGNSTSENYNILCIDKISINYIYQSIPENPNLNSIYMQKNKIVLKWNPPNITGGSSILGYKIYRGLAPGNERLIDNILNADIYIDNFDKFEDNQLYFYFITAINEFGESEASIELSITYHYNFFYSNQFLIISLIFAVIFCISIFFLMKKFYPIIRDDISIKRTIKYRDENWFYEIKKELHIATSETKAEFIRDMISLANMGNWGRRNTYLIIGITSKGEQWSFTDPHLLNSANYEQIILEYVNPTIEFELITKKFRDFKIPIFKIYPKRNTIFRVKRVIKTQDEKNPKKQNLLNVDDSWQRIGDSKKKMTNDEIIKFAFEIKKF